MSLNLLKYGEIVPCGGGSLVESNGIFLGNGTSSKIVHIHFDNIFHNVPIIIRQRSF